MKALSLFYSLLFGILLFLPESQAQQYLYLKKTGTTKMKRLKLGDPVQINFSLEDPFFIEGNIRSIRHDLLRIDETDYQISEIVQFRTYSNELVVLSNAMKWGSLIYLGLMVINSGTDSGPVIKVGPALGAVSVFGSSFIVKRAARKTYNLNGPWRLEIIDFDTFENEENQ